MAALKLEWETPISPLSPELSYPYGAPLAALSPGAFTTPNGRLVRDGSLVDPHAHAPRASPPPRDLKIEQSHLTPRLHGRASRQEPPIPLVTRWVAGLGQFANRPVFPMKALPSSA